MPRKIQRSRKKGARTPTDSVYVGRPSIWGNPWDVKSAGSQAMAVVRWKRWLDGDPQYAHIEPQRRALILQRLPQLRKVAFLTCWCADGTPCHAHDIIERVNKLEATP